MLEAQPLTRVTAINPVLGPEAAAAVPPAACAVTAGRGLTCRNAVI
jgi:hypothetical protein